MIGKGLPPSSMKVSRLLLGDLLKPPAFVAGLGPVIRHITDKIGLGQASIPESLPSNRAAIWTNLFSDEVVMELAGSAF